MDSKSTEGNLLRVRVSPPAPPFFCEVITQHPDIATSEGREAGRRPGFFLSGHMAKSWQTSRIFPFRPARGGTGVGQKGGPGRAPWGTAPWRPRNGMCIWRRNFCAEKRCANITHPSVRRLPVRDAPSIPANTPWDTPRGSPQETAVSGRSGANPYWPVFSG